MIRSFNFRSVAIAATLLVLFACSATAADPMPEADFAKPGRVLVMRHANAPGTGDPENFKLSDCATQRNLDAAGRAQAAQIGRRLAKAGVKGIKVYSSQWCRCLETARLLAVGPVTQLPALNSFFARAEERDEQIALLRQFLAGLPVDGPPVVLVTHQVTVTALTGVYPESANGVILQLNGTVTPRIVGEFKSGKRHDQESRCRHRSSAE
jgi:broad specificity phosphatase PhoE